MIRDDALELELSLYGHMLHTQTCTSKIKTWSI